VQAFGPTSVTAQIVSRLVQELNGQLPRPVVEEVVDQSLSQLQTVNPAALPEMLERLARHRLTYLEDSAAWSA
jgi:hypothetical protein